MTTQRTSTNALFSFLIDHLVRHKLQTCLRCKSKLLYIKLFILTSRFQKCLLRFFQCFEGKGQRSKVSAINKVTIWVLIQMHYRSYNLIFQINFPQDVCIWRTLMTLTFHLKGYGHFSIKWTKIYFFVWKMSRFSSIYITVNGWTKHITSWKWNNLSRQTYG